MDKRASVFGKVKNISIHSIKSFPMKVHE